MQNKTCTKMTSTSRSFNDIVFYIMALLPLLVYLKSRSKKKKVNNNQWITDISIFMYYFLSSIYFSKTIRNINNNNHKVHMVNNFLKMLTNIFSVLFILILIRPFYFNYNVVSLVWISNAKKNFSHAIYSYYVFAILISK